jgi:lipopolysaccharide export system protein LptA
MGWFRDAVMVSVALTAGWAHGLMVPASAQKSGKALAVLPGASGKEPINIDAGKLEYFDKEQKAVYSGAVVAVQGESRLKTEVLTIFLDRAAPGGGQADPGSAGQVRRMEATGGVTIVQKDQVGTGDRGEYDKVANKVYLYGNVTLSQGPNVVKGGKLTYDLTSGQAVMEDKGGSGRVQSIIVPGSQPEGTDASQKSKGTPRRKLKENQP